MAKLDKWEFGSLEWCEFASNLGVNLIRRAELELDRFEWGFSEEYLATPDRLMDGRNVAGYHLMIRGGELSGGPFIPEECLALPGFHVATEWAMIAHSSYLPFNTVGNQERGEAHVRLRRELEKVGVGNGKWELESHIQNDEGVYPRCRACGSDDHERVECRVWPPGIGEALGSNPDSAAKRWRLKRSPELEEFPESEWGVPLFHEMDSGQQSRFLRLMGYEKPTPGRS